MRAELIGIAKPDNLVIKSVPAVIGQDTAADIQCDDSPKSNYYCLISRTNDHLVVWDLGAGGGTYVNGVRVTKATLKASDTLRLGETEFSVRYEHGPQRYLYGLRC